MPRPDRPARGEASPTSSTFSRAATGTGDSGTFTAGYGRPSWRLFVAAAGYGKTTALEAATEGRPAVAFDAAALLERLATAPVRDLLRTPDDESAAILAVDDLGRLSRRDQVALIRAVGAGPDDDLDVVVAIDRPLAEPIRRALVGPVVETGAAGLALTEVDAARVLREEHGIDDPDLAWLVHDLTAGWPALVHLAGSMLAGQPSGAPGRQDLLAALSEAGTPGHAWVVERVIAALSGPGRRLLDLIGDLDPVTPALARELAGGAAAADPAGLAVERVDATVDRLLRTGLLVAVRPLTPTARPARLRVVPVLGAVLAGRPPARATRGFDRLGVAAAWYERHGEPLAAAQSLARSGNLTGAAQVLAARGGDMLAAGGAQAVVDLLSTGSIGSALSSGQPSGPVPNEPPPDTSASGPEQALRLLAADAARTTGDATGAQRALAPLLGELGRPGDGTPALAWRAARIAYMGADFRAAVATCAGAAAEIGVERLHGHDGVLLLACWSSALFMVGDVEGAEARAAQALSLAVTGDDRALATAHLAMSVTTTGARRDHHLAGALAAAERAGDVVQTARVLVNQADVHLREPDYRRACEVAERAVAVAGRASPTGMLVSALHNAGDALAMRGRFDAAIQRYERAIRICRRVGLSRVAGPLAGLAEVHRQLGRPEQGRAAFEQAVGLARETGERQVLVPALAGLARVLLDGPEADRPLAVVLADEAVREAPAELLPCALTARGWAALRVGDVGSAEQCAAEAVRAARAVRAADALAAALELTAAVRTEPEGVRAALCEALAIWRAAGAGPAADRLTVRLARLPGADGEQRAAARAALRRLTAAGAAVSDGAPLLRAEGAVGGVGAVQVRVLGGFEVTVGGMPVPFTAWRSRQARSLVKVLVSRRGRPVPRPVLCELLWPDDDPQRTGHRLSVLLSVVRGVLDPTKTWPPDYYIAADLTGVRLDLRHVGVDVEDFLRDAADAADLVRAGRHGVARDLLTDLDRVYRGDAFDDEPYEDWADGLREEARGARSRALRTLAQVARGSGDHHQAAGVLVRLLAADAYDEESHGSLVAALVDSGRHGEARRAFARWTDAMRSIDAPLPDVAVLRRRTPAESGRATAPSIGHRRSVHA